MKHYFWQKTISAITTVFLVSLLTFVILQVLPGDPALLMLGTEGNPESYDRLRMELRLDEPILKRYFIWLGQFLQGNLGVSQRFSMPISQLVGDAFPLSFSLAMLAVIVALLFSVPAGIFMASKQDGPFTRLLALATHVGMALPQFWLGLILIQFFAVRLGVLPSGGSQHWAGLILPILTLAIPRIAILTRLVQTGMLEALSQDYIRTAHAKGLPRYKVLFKHAFRNGSLAVLTVAGLQFANLLAGTIVVEQVFSLPGLGQLLLAGVLQRDIPLVQGIVMLAVILILLFDLLFDLSLGFLDPRLRYE